MCTCVLLEGSSFLLSIFITYGEDKPVGYMNVDRWNKLNLWTALSRVHCSFLNVPRQILTLASWTSPVAFGRLQAVHMFVHLPWSDCLNSYLSFWILVVQVPLDNTIPTYGTVMRCSWGRNFCQIHCLRVVAPEFITRSNQFAHSLIAATVGSKVMEYIY